MAEPKYLADFKALTRADPTFAELEAIEQQIYGESDRVAVIMLGSMVERSLRRLIAAATHEDPAADDRRTFFAKIEDAEARALIGPISRGDLNLVRELRNGFAHSRMPLDLTTPEVAAVCDHLQVPDLGGSFIPHGYMNRVSDDKLEEASDKAHPRTRFITACHNLAYRMIVARTPREELQDAIFSDNPLP